MSLMRSHINITRRSKLVFPLRAFASKPYSFTSARLSACLKNALRAIKLNSVLKMFALGRTKCQNCF